MKLTDEQIMELHERVQEADIPSGSAIFIFSWTKSDGIVPSYKLNNLTVSELFLTITVGRRLLDSIEKQYYDKLSESFVETQEDDGDAYES